MRTGDKKIFRDKQKLYAMINLRRIGFATTSLALIYDCHRDSIEEQCHKYHIVPLDKVYTVERIVNSTLPKPKPVTYKIVNGERINLGKSYKDYLI